MKKRRTYKNHRLLVSDFPTSLLRIVVDVNDGVEISRVGISSPLRFSRVIVVSCTSRLGLEHSVDVGDDCLSLGESGSRFSAKSSKVSLESSGEEWRGVGD